MQSLEYVCKEKPEVILKLSVSEGSFELPAHITLYGATEDTHEEEYVFWWHR